MRGIWIVLYRLNRCKLETPSCPRKKTASSTQSSPLTIGCSGTRVTNLSQAFGASILLPWISTRMASQSSVLVSSRIIRVKSYERHRRTYAKRATTLTIAGIMLHNIYALPRRDLPGRHAIEIGMETKSRLTNGGKARCYLLPLNLIARCRHKHMILPMNRESSSAFQDSKFSPALRCSAPLTRDVSLPSSLCGEGAVVKIATPHLSAELRCRESVSIRSQFGTG